MTLATVWQFVIDHEAVICLIGLAFAVTMPDDLPAPFSRSPFLVWWWSWFHNGVKAFVSFRSPTATQRTTYTQETPAMTTTQTSESSATIKVQDHPSEGGK